MLMLTLTLLHVSARTPRVLLYEYACAWCTKPSVDVWYIILYNIVQYHCFALPWMCGSTIHIHTYILLPTVNYNRLLRLGQFGTNMIMLRYVSLIGSDLLHGHFGSKMAMLKMVWMLHELDGCFFPKTTHCNSNVGHCKQQYSLNNLQPIWLCLGYFFHKTAHCKLVHGHFGTKMAENVVNSACTWGVFLP